MVQIFDRKEGKLLLLSEFGKRYDNGFLNPLLKIIENKNRGIDEKEVDSEVLDTIKNIKANIILGCRMEWQERAPYIEEVEDGVCELCGYKPLSIYYYLENKINGSVLKVGSECVKKMTESAYYISSYQKFANPQQFEKYIKFLTTRPIINEAIKSKVNKSFDLLNYKIVLPSRIYTPLHKVLKTILENVENYCIGDNVGVENIDQLEQNYISYKNEAENFYEDNKNDFNYLTHETLSTVHSSERRDIATRVSNNGGKISASLASKFPSYNFYSLIMDAYNKNSINIHIHQLFEDTSLYYDIELNNVRFSVPASHFIKNYCNHLFSESKERNSTVKEMICECVSVIKFTDNNSLITLQKRGLLFIENNSRYTPYDKLFDILLSNKESEFFNDYVSRLRETTIPLKLNKSGEIGLVSNTSLQILGVYDLVGAYNKNKDIYKHIDRYKNIKELSKYIYDKKEIYRGTNLL